MAASSSSRGEGLVPSGLMLKNISPEESEFLAAETPITITSNIAHSEFNFISGNFGPLYPGMPCELPLWLALQLRRTGKCTIVIPEWMTVTRLEAAIEDERKKDDFSPLPFHYIEVAQQLMTHAREDIASPDQVHVLLQDLENIRLDRIKHGLGNIAEKAREDAVKRINLTGIASLEVLQVKAFMTQSLALFERLIDKEAVSRGLAQQDAGGGGSSGGGAGGGGGGGGGSSAPLRPLRRFRTGDDS